MFADGMRAFTATVNRRLPDVFVNVATAVLGSVVEGSAVTGSPGQPVDTGALKASWQLTFESPTEATISTNLVYAPVIEDNLRGAKLRSAVGGFHSVKLTAAGFDRLVQVEAAKVHA